MSSAGCERPSSSSHVERLPERGELSADIGESPPVSFGLAGANCRITSYRGRSALLVRARGVKRFELPDRTLQPHLVSAVLPPDLGAEPVEFSGEEGDERWEIVASLLDVALRGDDYEMLQLIGTRVDGVDPSFHCEASRTDDRIELSCEGLHPVPWFAPGKVPEASFEASVPCR